MTEEELIDLGFEKVDITNDESQNGYDYYYYTLDIMPGLGLTSSASDESQNGWHVYNFDWGTGVSLTKETILHLLQIAQAQDYQGQHHQ